MTRGSTDIIEDLRKEHDALYVRLFDHRARKKSGLESTKDHEALTRQVNTLLDKLEKIGPEIRLLDDYTWLINASLQWQAFAALLNINRKIKIPEPPDDGLWAPTQRLGKDDVDHWLASRERDICRLRHLEKFLWQIRHVVPDSSDAYIAKVYFAKDTLNGADSSTEQDSDGSKQRLDLVEKVPPSAYNYLEQVWFRDVIMVDAYLIWEREGAVKEWPAELRERDYLEACEQYRTLLANQQIKRETEKFISIRDHMTDKYLNGRQQLRPSARHSIIRVKAERLAETGGADSHANWVEAAAYVDGFYNNIVPAVMRPDREPVECVRRAILRSEGKHSRSSVMNVFEAAICIYFLRGFEYFADDWKIPTKVG